MSGLLASFLCSLSEKLTLLWELLLALRPSSKAQGPWFVSTTLAAWNEVIDAWLNGGRMKNMTKEISPKNPEPTNQQQQQQQTPNQKPILFQGCPRFPFLHWRGAVGWLWWCLYWNPASISRASPPLLERQFSLMDTFRFLWDSLPYRKIVARWDGLTLNPKPKLKFFFFSTAIQTWALPADYGSFPKWLSSCLVKRSLGLEEGWGPGWGARSSCGKGGSGGWNSSVRRKVFGSPRSTGHHRSRYSKCLLHCTSLWKKIVCWKVSKQTLY